MKKILFAFLLVVNTLMSSLSLFAQEKTIDISKLKTASFIGNYSKKINLDTKDTTYFVHIAFRNAKYNHIIDYKAILLPQQDYLDMFIKDLTTAIPERGTKQTIEWKRDLYAMAVYDWSKALYIYENPKEGDGHTKILNAEATRLKDWLETIEIGKDALKMVSK